jgi:TonB family protein
VVGGTDAPRAPKMLPPQMGALQKASGEDPDFPAVLRQRAGMLYVVLAKICVARTGTVDSVSILKGADSMLDRNVVTTVKGWRYRPLMADNNAVPFCYFGRFEFKSN